MPENELLKCVVALAKYHGWLCAHFRPALTNKGWRTPVEADGAGFPDLVLAKVRNVFAVVLFVELKSQKGKLSEAQKAWRDILYPTYYLWRPGDWISGKIEKVLEG
jgi:hypothetical protein